MDELELDTLINILTKVFENNSGAFTNSESEIAGTLLVKIEYGIISAKDGKNVNS